MERILKKGKATDADVQQLRKQYGLSADTPVFLYVGRDDVV